MTRSIKIRSLRPTALAAALLVLASATLAASADPPARVGRLAWLAGPVTLRDATGATPATLNWPVTSGQVLVTGPSGRAEVTVGATALTLDVDTEVDVEQLDDQQMRLRLAHGSLALRTADAATAAALAVLTPLGRVTQPQPGSLRVDVRGAALDATVDATAWRGNIGFVGSSGAAYSFSAGQHARLVASATGLSMTLLPVAADDFERVAQARASMLDSVGSVAAGSPVSPEMTGADALAANGQWQDSPEYGPVWLPTVATDWAPYRDGQWRWVAPWGWTWVHDAPWGFAPFHYGRWALWHDCWAWVPGAYVARPVYAPALVAWTGPVPVAPGVSVGVNFGGHFGPDVGWLPLAPHQAYQPSYAVSASYVRQINIAHVGRLPPAPLMAAAPPARPEPMAHTAPMPRFERPQRRERPAMAHRAPQHPHEAEHLREHAWGHGD